MVTDRKVLEEKSTRLVVVGMPEAGTKEETSKRDQKFVAALIDDFGDEELKGLFKATPPK